MKKKYAFLLLGGDYIPDVHQAWFETENGVTYICTARNFDEAREKVQELADMGVGAIELCGAFGAGLAREYMEQTGGKIAIGYVVHDSDQDALFERFFR